MAELDQTPPRPAHPASITAASERRVGLPDTVVRVSHAEAWVAAETRSTFGGNTATYRPVR